MELAHISSLSNEILLMILEYILPGDIINFSITCRSIHHLSASILREHKRLKSTCRIWSDYDDGENLITLLRKVLNYPRLAYYVEEIVCDIGGGEPPDHLAAGDLEAFKEAFRNSCFVIEDKNEIDLRIKEIEDSEMESILGLLMTLLPNLRQISFTNHPGDTPTFDSVIKCISRAHSTSASLLPLSKLQSLHMDYRNSHNPAGIDFLYPFLTLPSMRSVYARYVADSLEYPLVPMSSSVTDLALQSCSFSQTTILEFIGIFKALESFEYDPDDSLERQPSFSPFWVYRALSIHAKSSLKKLVLYKYIHPEETYPADFRRFNALTHITTHHRFLLGTPGPSQKPFGAVLPPSIERVTLKAPDHLHLPPNAINSLIENTIKTKDRLLPNLNSLTISNTSTPQQLPTTTQLTDWTLASKKAGIAFHYSSR